MALQGLISLEAGIALEGAADHGVSVLAAHGAGAVYVEIRVD